MDDFRGSKRTQRLKTRLDDLGTEGKPHERDRLSLEWLPDGQHESQELPSKFGVLLTSFELVHKHLH